MDLTHSMVQRSKFIEAMVQANGGGWPDLEALVEALYTSYVRPGDLALDVGVNRGVHLRKLATLVGPMGRVIGVEAVPAFADHAVSLLRSDGRQVARRVRLHRCAVAAQRGTAEFFVTSITDGGLSGLRLRPVIANEEFKKIKVRTRTLDALLRGRPKVRFAKIDIEGGEYDALRGAPRFLAQQPLMAFEFDQAAPEQFGFDPEALFGLLRRAGYRVCDIFGFEVESGAAMMHAVVWNFVAVPPGLDPIALTAPGRRILEANLPTLCAFAPTPSPPVDAPLSREDPAPGR